MNKQQYQLARRWIRDNGRAAYFWVGQRFGREVSSRLLDLSQEQDWLQERADVVAYCKREGLHCTPRHTAKR